MRIGNEVLAATVQLASGRCLEEDRESSPGRIGVGWAGRLMNIRHRQLLCASVFWEAKTGPNPTDRGKNGSKRHLMADGSGTPQAIAHTWANCHASVMAIPLVDEVSPIKLPRGASHKPPDEVLADQAFAAEDKIHKPLRNRGIRPLIARRNTELGRGLGKLR